MKIALFAYVDSFIWDLLEAIWEHDILLNVRYPRMGKRVENAVYGYLDGETVREWLEWCDIAIFDFARDPLPLATKLKQEGAIKCRIVVRFYDHELWQPLEMQYTNWSVIDKMIFLNKCIYETFLKKLEYFQGPQAVEKFLKNVEVHFIPTSVDVDKFRFVKDVNSFGKNLVYSGLLHHRKRIFTILETFYELLKHDPEWRLFIHGEWLDSIYRDWCMDLIRDYGLSGKVFFDSWIPRDTWLDIASSYYRDKDIFISNSAHEGEHVACLEAAACGVYPLVHYFPCCLEFYKPKWVFKTQVELLEKILEWSSKSPDEKLRLAMEAREWIVEKFDKKKIVPVLKKVVLE